MIESGCYNCKDRKVGCHAHCLKYLAYRKALDVINNRKREILKTERIMRRAWYGKGRWIA